MSNVEKNKDLVRRLYGRVMSEGAVDRLPEFYSDDYVDHRRFGDLDGLKKALTDHFQVYDTIRFEILGMVAEGQRVVARAAITAKAQDSEKVISEISIFRIEQGKIVECWSHSDSFY